MSLVGLVQLTERLLPLQGAVAVEFSAPADCGAAACLIQNDLPR